jgi:hypothetical protein
MDPSLGEVDPNSIEDDGDEGLEYVHHNRGSMLSLGHQSVVLWGGSLLESLDRNTTPFRMPTAERDRITITSEREKRRASG